MLYGRSFQVGEAYQVHLGIGRSKGSETALCTRATHVGLLGGTLVLAMAGVDRIRCAKKKKKENTFLHIHTFTSKRATASIKIDMKDLIYSKASHANSRSQP